MDYYGQLPKYPINRPLTEDERADQLKQKQKLKDVEPHYNLSVIRINSTYLEIVDKFYVWKGMMFFIGMFFVILVSGFYLITIIDLIPKLGESGQEDLPLVLAAMTVMCLPFIGVGIWLALLESFTYTHYPIILNRKTRMVHVFQRNGSVLSVPWDDIFFAFNKSVHDWNIRGHVLGTDGVTVKETFSFPMFGDRKDMIVRYWEFVRRYMEEGPAKLIGHDIGKVETCHPIIGRRESFKWGLLGFYAQFESWPFWLLILYPFLTLCGIFRYLAMLTCDKPEWPKRVLDTCIIEPGDPYERDARHNPPNA